MTTPRPPVCGFELDGRRCSQRGDHFCRRRAARVVAFFSELLVHTKGDWARRPFTPARWQREEVLEPLFGRVRWDAGRGRYVRQYRELYLNVARKNGKSELLAGILLYVLVGEAEEGGEIYGLALDRDQAAIVWRMAARMIDLSSLLRSRIDVIRSTSRLLDRKTASFFTVAAGDALGSLGANPSAAYIDELLSQPSRELYDVIQTSFGTRAEPLLLLATTAENDPGGFAATEREFSERVLEDPRLAPDRLVVIHSAPKDADWTDERTWRLANPALGDYLDLEVLRAEFVKAMNNPPRERAFRQFRLNQPQNAVGRAIDLRVWDRGGRPFRVQEQAGEACWGGFDLAQTHDLATLCWVFRQEERYRAVWRCWTPQANLSALDRRTGGQASVWADEGWLTVTEGEVIDYQVIKQQIRADAALFGVQENAYDPWGMTQLVQDLLDEGFRMVQMRQGWATMSAPTSEVLRLIAGGMLEHGGNPLVRWCAANAVVRTDAAGNLKWDKERSVEKIDPIVALTMAVGRAMVQPKPRKSAYDDASLAVV